MTDEPAPPSPSTSRDAAGSGRPEGHRRGSADASRRAVMTAAAAALGSLTIEACSAPPPPAPSADSGSATGTPAGRAVAGGSTSAATPHSANGVHPLETTGPDIRRGPSEPSRVALTFHGAGPRDLTLRVLEVARAHGARLTVFAVGTWLETNPALGKAILAAGHELGNHTYSHRPMRRLTAAQADAEVSRGAAAVAAVRGSAGLLFRPSGTQLSTPTIRAAALAAGYHRCVSYDVDPQDYLDPGAAAVRDRTLAAALPGSIVSLHLGHPGTVAALPGILDGLERRGLAAVTVTQLLAGPA